MQNIKFKLIKKERKDSPFPQLLMEAKLYKILEGGCNKL